MKDTVNKMKNVINSALIPDKKAWIEKTHFSTSDVDEFNNSELFLVIKNSYGAYTNFLKKVFDMVLPIEALNFVM